MNQNDEKYRAYLASEEWKRIATERMRIDKYMCQCCGCKGTERNALEVHHLSYSHLYKEQTRIYEDLVTLCHDCHKGMHKAMERVTAPNGRRGWKDNPRIPQVHVFNINGINNDHLEVHENE